MINVDIETIVYVNTGDFVCPECSNTLEFKKYGVSVTINGGLHLLSETCGGCGDARYSLTTDTVEAAQVHAQTVAIEIEVSGDFKTVNLIPEYSPTDLFAR